MAEIQLDYTALTEGLITKSAKIRALAKAGVLRTEIAKLLDIRYQHVRKVLEDAGIKEGKKSAPVAGELVLSIELPPRPSKQVGTKFFLDRGFEHIGEWQKMDKGISLSAKASRQHGVYVFLLNDVAVYIGLTLNALHIRMDQYRRGHKGQKTSARVHGLIRAAVENGDEIKVLTVTPEASDWMGLPVNTATGLEAGLIDDIRPLWNIRGNR